MNNEISELSMNELDAVSSGKGAAQIALSGICEVAGEIASALHMYGAAVVCFNAAETILH